MNLEKCALLGFLKIWTQFMWECLDDKEIWTREGHAKAEAQLKELIENYYEYHQLTTKDDD